MDNIMLNWENYLKSNFNKTEFTDFYFELLAFMNLSQLESREMTEEEEELDRLLVLSGMISFFSKYKDLLCKMIDDKTVEMEKDFHDKFFGGTILSDDCIEKYISKLDDLKK